MPPRTDLEQMFRQAEEAVKAGRRVPMITEKQITEEERELRADIVSDGVFADRGNTSRQKWVYSNSGSIAD